MGFLPIDPIPSRVFGLLPAEPGCYMFRDSSGEILYIGKARDLRQRVASYFKARLETRLASMVAKAAGIDFLVTDNETEALLLENTLIKKHQPRYNVNLKDAKQFAYIGVSRETFPRIFLSRRGEEDAAFYGPFVSGRERDDLIRLLSALFKLRTCRRMRPGGCLRRHLGRCLGPCLDKGIAPAYLEALARAERVLAGQSSELVKELEQEMRELADRREYELARERRDQIRALQGLLQRQKMSRDQGIEEDVIHFRLAGGRVFLVVFHIERGMLNDKEEFVFDFHPGFLDQFLLQYYENRRPPAEIILPERPSGALTGLFKKEFRSSIRVPRSGARRELLDLAGRNVDSFFLAGPGRARALQEALHLPAYPGLLECFDISHTSGTEPVGVMVTFRDGRPDKRSYRRFLIKTTSAGDDCLALAECVRRCYRRRLQDKKPLPDLLLIDGGRAQLSAAAAELAALELDLPLAALAKEEELLFLQGNPEPLRLEQRDPALLLLRHLRDEAHRFALTYHRLRRRKRALQNSGRETRK